MTITISVVGHNGHAPAQALAAEFDELGGSIGRGHDNTLVLPDPERHISRRHAAIRFNAGRYVIRDTSSGAPVHLNGRGLGTGQEAELGEGDEIVIGVYTLRVAGACAPKESPPPQHSTPVPVGPALPGDGALARLMEDPLAPRAAEASTALVPDFDPLAEAGKTPAAAPEHAWLPQDFDTDLGPVTTKAQRIDEMFGLGSVASADPCAPGNALADRREAQASRARPQRNDVAELHSAFRPAPSKPAPRAATPVPAAKVGGEDLLRAFLQGAGVPQLKLAGGLTPQTMHMLGALLREATQGTLNLLLARAVVKREVRADRTLIAPRENNPLKLSPNVEVALAHLLTPQNGFMAPLAAMKDAQRDLCAHQFGVVAGMRAALAGVLQRFDPKRLARRLSGKHMVETLLPGKRKTRLWDLFEQLYGDVSREAEEDFHTLFGKEFLRAYAAQVDKLAQQDKRAGGSK